jgi:hypothetical protein
MKKTPSRINEEVKTLKLNVTNIRSIIIQKNKTKEKLKKKRESGEKKKKSFEKLKSEEKNLEKKKKIPVVSRAFSKVKDTGANILDKILNFGGLILAGILVNNLPKIIETVRDIIDSIVNFLTPIQSGFNLIKAFFTGEINQSKYDADKKRVDDSLSQLSKKGGLIDQLAEKAGPLGGLIKLLKPAVEQIRNVMGGKRKVLAVKDGKEGVKDLDTGEFTERQFTQAERSKYIQSGGQGAGGVSSSGSSAGGQGAGGVSSSGSSGKYGSLLDFIGSGEGGYNSMNQGTRGNRIVGSTGNASSKIGKNLTDMTIGEIMDRQAYLMNPNNPQISDYGIFAAGKYQIIPDTMPGAVRGAGLSRSDKFTPQNQDKLGMALIMNKRPYVGKYLRGEHNDVHGAMMELAREFASMPDPNTGRSLYGSGNRAFHSVDEVREALIKARNKPQAKITPKPSGLSNYGPNYKEEEKMLFDRSNKLKDQQVSTISKPIDDEEEESSILVAVQRIYNTKSIPFPTYIPV